MPMINIAGNHLPSTVHSSQWICSEAVSQVLSRAIKRHYYPIPASSQQAWSKPASQVTWCQQEQSQCNFASQTSKHALYNLISQSARMLFCTLPRLAGNPYNTWELQHCIPMKKNYPAVLFKSEQTSKNTSTYMWWILLPWDFSLCHIQQKLPFLRFLFSFVVPSFAMVHCEQHFSLLDFK